MNVSKDNLLNVPAIQQRVSDFARQLWREGFVIHTTPMGDGSRYIEVDDAYHLVAEERGVEFERRTTSDLDELLFWILSGLTSRMASDYEVRNRREREDSRRQVFATDLELLELLSPAWAKRRRAEYDEILRTHPFHDS
jgi:hypothetical protein